MREWTQFKLKKNGSERFKEFKIKTFEDHEKLLGSYKYSNYFLSKKNFFKRYLSNHRKIWNRILQKKINKNHQTLSVGSGLGINELLLIKKNFKVDCSDLKIPDSYKFLRKIFGKYKYKKLDILKKNLNKKYHNIICLSVAYTFNKKKMNIFFKNVNKSLKKDGKLYLDIGGSSDTFSSLIYDKYYLRVESEIIFLIYRLLNNKISFYKYIWGFKYKNSEIISIAENNGLKYQEIYIDDYENELNRSKIISTMIKYLPFAKYLFYLIGFKMPYVRLFEFVKA